MLERLALLSLLFAGDSVSVLSLWHKQVPKSSYKKCRFALMVVLKSCSVYICMASLSFMRNTRKSDEAFT